MGAYGEANAKEPQMTATRQIPTKVRDLRPGHTVMFQGVRQNVVRNLRQANGFYTLQVQEPGTPIWTFRDADPDFTFTRIGL